MAESRGNVKDIALYKLDRAKEDLESAEIELQAEKYRASNKRAYYSAFHAIDAVLALEPIAFKKHKDVIAYFNKNYVHEGKFPADIGRRIHELEEIRHESDYSDFFIASKEDSMEQVNTARELLALVETFIQTK